MDVPRVTAEEAQRLMKRGHAYLDVRTPAEFAAGHVPGARNVPVFEQDPYGRMVPNIRFVEIVEHSLGREQAIITGCQMGGRSLRAAAMLRAAGFTKVVDLRGGLKGECDALGRVTYPGWETLGLPMTAETATGDDYAAMKQAADRAGGRG